VRLKVGTRLTQLQEAEPQIRQAREWSGRQWQVIEILLAELRQADQQRQHWHRLIAQEVLAEPDLLSLVRLCGVREIIALSWCDQNQTALCDQNRNNEGQSGFPIEPLGRWHRI
jgi:hypothetical protein